MSNSWLITGASRGIGLEFVRQLAARGHRVLATARDPAKAPHLAPPAHAVLPLEATDDRSILALTDRLAAHPIDVLVNNAGVSSETRSIADLTSEALLRVLHVNAAAPLVVVRAALPALRAGARRTIINISSQLGSIANNSGGSTYAYRASKAALNMLTVSLANELRPEGFTCVAMHPGWVRTDMGGPQAPLTPTDSVASMIAVIERLTATDSGRFLNYDGKPLPW
jgi:NAD(P)-dependent dehydrogenase (short-subunit alcohol dehydrogenase family)